MKESNTDTIRFYGAQGCFGLNLAVALQPAEENDVVNIINGVLVAIQPETIEQLTDVTINAEENDVHMGLV